MEDQSLEQNNILIELSQDSHSGLGLPPVLDFSASTPPDSAAIELKIELPADSADEPPSARRPSGLTPTALKPAMGLTRLSAVTRFVFAPWSGTYPDLFRLGLVLTSILIAVPYPIWLWLVPGLNSAESSDAYINGNVMFKMFMTITNNVALLGYSARMILARNQPIRLTYWKHFIAWVWTLASMGAYGIWAVINVMSTVCPAEVVIRTTSGNQTLVEEVYHNSGGVCTLFVFVYITGFLRFGIPIVLLLDFIQQCQVYRDMLDAWAASFTGLRVITKADLRERSARLDAITKEIAAFAHTSQWILLACAFMPIFTMILLCLSSLFDSAIIQIVDKQWVFWVVCVHYSSFGALSLYAISQLSLEKYEKAILGVVAMRGVEDYSALEWSFKFIESSRYSFKIFFIALSASTYTSCFMLLLTVVAWLLDYVL